VAADCDALPARATALRRLLAAFKDNPVLSPEAVRAFDPARGGLKRLLARGWVRSAPREGQPERAGGVVTVSCAPQPTTEQERAADSITQAFGRFEAFVLYGITGSGKTEVYLRAIAAAMRAGRQALLLVPEIVLTPQLEALVRQRFPQTHIAILHSRLGEGARARNWRAAQSGEAGVILGTRLAVFTPIPNLGLIVVDEEHDPSFKQMEGLRYSARDLGVVRAKHTRVPVVLGSATPALETYHNALSGRYRLLQLTQRIGAVMPRIECVDTRGTALADGLSPALLAAVAERLQRREQSLIFINRRGYAPVLLCRACGWLSACHRCSAQLVVHLPERRLRCHHCGFRSPVPAACPSCGNQDLAPVGQGTQRVEAALAGHFPTARILRIDRDTTRGKDAWPAMRRQIHAGEVDILVGTQILAKGHDFPRLNFVGVLNSDSLLYSTDFRAAERLFALLTQVAGRAGRASIQGEVMIQTEFPNHPLYVALAGGDYAAFATTALAERRQAGFPPFVHQALLRAEAVKLDTALTFLADAAQIGAALSPDVLIYDAVPATMVRLAGRERAHLLVQSASRAGLQAFLSAWLERLPKAPSASARWSLDVDPVEF
jgi:primosomal protein N' (replication factor Y)